MKLEAAVAMTQMKTPDRADKLEQNSPGGGQGQDEKDPARGGLFGRLHPVNQAMHAKLTKSGYKHTGNYLSNNGQGNFGYYQHPVTGHQVTVDDAGNVQEQMPVKQTGGQGGSGGQRGGAGGGGMWR
jgi:hypothetical protein